MRKLQISVGLALLLLAQQGAILHGVSHIGRVAADMQARVHPDNALEKTCELCFAFSQVANPASNTVTVAHFEPSSCAAGSLPCCAATPRDVLAPRSRGPPTPSSKA